VAHPDDSFSILHIGDIHLNAPSKFDQSDWQEFRAMAVKHGPYDAIVATGDFGTGGKVNTLNAGVKLIVDLRDRLVKEFGRPVQVVMTPGNHDVRWPQSSDTATDLDTRMQQVAEALKPYPEIVRPLLTEDERGHGLVESRHSLWFKDKRVMIVPFSSVDMSGSMPTARYEFAWGHFMGGAIRNKKRRQMLEGLIRQDVPYIMETQRTSVRDYFQARASTADADTQREIRIAVVHHPLFGVAAAEDVRAYPTVANGRVILELLHQFDFHLVLHGHDHCLRLSVDWGSTVCSASDRTEREGARGMVAVSGGHLGQHLESGDHYGFQVIRIKQRPLPQGREISATQVYLKSAGRATQQDEPLLRTDMSGKTRWLRCDSYPHRFALSPQTTIAKNFARTVESVETAYAKHKTRFRGRPDVDQIQDDYEYVDKYITKGLQDIRDYAEGIRGVSKDFVNTLVRRVQDQDTRAVMFVDRSGKATWLQPDLMEHCAQLFRIYMVRNRDRITSVGEPRDWKFVPELEQAVLMRGLSPSPELRSVTTGERDLHFDMARVLLWREEELRTVAGRILIRLHRAYDVPLFWVNQKNWKKDTPDYHLIWNQNSVPFEGEPSEAWEYDEAALTRKEIVSSTSKKALAATFRELIERATPVEEIPEIVDDLWTVFED